MINIIITVCWFVVALWLFILAKVNKLSYLFFQALSIFTIFTGVFDLYSYVMAAPGSVHYGYYFISYQFVYVGNKHGNFISFSQLYLLFLLLLFMLMYNFCFSEKYIGSFCSFLCACGYGYICYQHNAYISIKEGNNSLMFETFNK